MKIAVNIHCLHPPLTGIGHYARNLLLRLREDARVEELVGISNAGWHSQQELFDILSHSRGYELIEQQNSHQLGRRIWNRGRRLLPAIPGAGRARAWLNHRLDARERSSTAQYIYWEPNYLLLPIDNPALVTVHDLSHLRYPEYHPPARIRELERLQDTLAAAAAVAAVSEFTRGEISEHFGLDPNTIAVIPPAVSGVFKPAAEDEIEHLRNRYALPPKFVLFAGTIEPRKNLSRLLQAYCRLPEALQSEYPLILAGGDGWHLEEFEASYRRLDTRHVHRLGYVAREGLPVLISAASLLVYPSIYEGFGMPILEAMACGTAVLTSNVASMPEVAAGAAQLVDPFSVDAIQSGLEQCLLSSTLRDDMCQRGSEVAARHNWHDSADQLVATLQRVAGS